MSTKHFCDKCKSEIIDGKNRIAEVVDLSDPQASAAKVLWERVTVVGPPALDRVAALVVHGPNPPKGDLCAHCAIEALSAKLGPRGA